MEKVPSRRGPTARLTRVAGALVLPLLFSSPDTPNVASPIEQLSYSEYADRLDQWAKTFAHERNTVYAAVQGARYVIESRVKNGTARRRALSQFDLAWQYTITLATNAEQEFKKLSVMVRTLPEHGITASDKKRRAHAEKREREILQFYADALQRLHYAKEVGFGTRQPTARI